MKKALICKLLGHVYHPIPNYSSHNVRRCDRCGKIGYEVPKR